MNNWIDVLNYIEKEPYYIKIQELLKKEEEVYTIYPSKEFIFRALKETPLNNIKVVILGQDPYHEDNQACGLAFSVPKGEKVPPSLKNIFQELANDLNIKIPNHGDLTSWAKQGVLLLNTVLTVRKHQAKSHQHLGWQKVTDEFIKIVNAQNQKIVFILLGNDAKTKKNLITNPNHLILEAAHPSPLSSYRGFFGSQIFSKTNKFLIKNNISPINWNSINE